MPRLKGSILWASAFALGGLGGLVAGRYVLEQSGIDSVVPSPAPQTYVVADGTLSRSLSLTASAQWTPSRQIFAPSGGVVTELIDLSVPPRAGEAIMRVDERPVVLIGGEVPAFRPLEIGSRGRDVAAMQAFLGGTGYEVDPDPLSFTATTRTAVMEWQTALGVAPTGRVELGEILIVDGVALGQPLRWTANVVVGSQIAAGMAILELLGPSPSLEIRLGASAPTQLQEGAHGRARFPGNQEIDVVLARFHSFEGQLAAELAAPQGVLCDPADCIEIVPTQGVTEVAVEFVLVPETVGAIVPAVAVMTDAVGSSFVVLRDGHRQAVEVVVESGGLVILRGIDAGQEIVLP